MQTVIYALVAFIFIACAFKLSMWKLWQTLVYSFILFLFILLSQRYAILQSKTQILSFLQSTKALENMAIIVTLDSVFGFSFVAMCFNYNDKALKNKWYRKLLFYFPPLLIFPASFLILTQVIFSFVGVDFSLTTITIALIESILLPLLSFGIKKLFPVNDARLEMLLILTCFLTVLGLIATSSGKMVYANKANPIDPSMIVFSLITFAIMFLLGIILGKMKYRFYNRNK
ncbi:MAG: hypothetical protein LUC37_04575 [Prevotella sp.]|nr:hypothetical protein [Prevotella sp.]